MKHKILPALLAIASVIISFIGIVAATPPSKVDFSGNWNINLQKSELGESAPKEMKLTQTDDSLFIERITLDNKSFTEKLSFDGKTCISVTTSKRRKSGPAHWDTGERSFTETAVLGEVNDADKLAFNVIEHWQLSEDGKQVTVESTVTNADGISFTIKAVYDGE